MNEAEENSIDDYGFTKVDIPLADIQLVKFDFDNVDIGPKRLKRIFKGATEYNFSESSSEPINGKDLSV